MSPRDLVLVVVINLIWGFNIVASKYGVSQVPPLFFTAMRFFILGMVLLPVLRPHRGQMKKLILIGLTMGVMHFGLMFIGLEMANDVTTVAIAIQLGIPFATLLSVIFLGERLGIWRVSGLVLAFSGVLLIGFDPVVFEYVGALALVVSAAMFGATGLLLMKKLDNVGVFELQGWIATISWPFLALLSFVFEDQQIARIMDAPIAFWPAVFYTALMASLIGHGGMYYLIRKYDISHVTPTFLLSTVFAVVFGVTVLGDNLTWRMIVGGLITLTGILIIMLRRAQAPLPVASSAVHITTSEKE